MSERPTPAMEASGLGLLPGLAVALGIGLSVLALALLDSWWAVPLIALALMALTVAVVMVVLALLEDDEDERGLRRRIPGL